MGIVSFLGSLKWDIMAAGNERTGQTQVAFLFFGHAPQTFRWEASKNIWGTNISGRMDIAPSKLLHGRMAAFGTKADVKAPDRL